jgi:hypothetical protein
MKHRDETTLDPTIQRELDALEDALAGRAPEPELADLAQLAHELQGLREAPSEEFAAMLDDRAARGFPREPLTASLLARLPDRGATAALARRLRDAAPHRLRDAAPRRKLLPALAGAATVLVVGAVVVATGRSGGGAGGTAPLPAVSSGAPKAAPSGAGGAARAPIVPRQTVPGSPGASPDLIVPEPPSPGIGAAPGIRNRKVERSAQLTLGTDADHLQAVAGAVFDVVGRYRGIVLSSSIGTGGEREAAATFDLMIPSARLGDALTDLSGLADVRSRSESTLDITAPFVSAGERLRDARAEAEGLLRQLATAGTGAERASLEARLRIVRGRIAALGSQLRRLRRRADFSRVSLQIVTGDQATILGGAYGGGGDWTIGDALKDAGRVLSVAAGLGLVALAVMLPVTLLGRGAWLARRIYVRRAREQALSG